MPLYVIKTGVPFEKLSYYTAVQAGQQVQVPSVRLQLPICCLSVVQYGTDQESAVLQEDLLRQLLIESKAYGSLLGSGAVGDPGTTAQSNIMREFQT